MLTSRFPAAFWLVLLTVWAARAGYGAEPISRLGPSQTMDPAEQGQPERTPVISSITLGPSGKLLATSGDDHLVRIWDIRTGELIRVLTGHADWVRCAMFSPDGEILATAGNDRRIRLWNVSSAEPLVWPPGPKQAVHALAFSPDGKRLAAAGFGQGVSIYEAGSGRVARSLDGPGPDIRALSFSPDGSQLAAAGRSGLIRVWSTESGERIHDLAGHRRRVCALAYSPDGSRLASAGDERDVRLWDTGTGEAAGALPPRPAIVLAVVFCGPSRLAVGGSDNLIRIWDLDTVGEQFELVGHTGSVTTLVWDAQVPALLSGSFDTTVRLWRLPDADMERISQTDRTSGRMD